MNKKTLTITIMILTILALITYGAKLPTANAQTSNQTGQLTITGLVANPLTLTLADIKAMPNTTEYAQLFCVASATSPVQKGNWTGVPLAYLLQQANVSSDALKIAFFATDGYSTDLTVQLVTQDNDIIVAYQFNSNPTSGLQLVVPLNWGYKWISDLTQIQLVNYNFLGTTENQGYPDDASTANAYMPPDTLPTYVPLPEPNGNPTSTPTAFPPTPMATANQTTPTAASNPQPQPASTTLFFAVAASVIAASAAVSATILIKRKKTGTRVN
jgi:Oxidoreductase molybdopterin binding domain